MVLSRRLYDSVVGGGGLISTPALLAIGLPPSVALGTNKLASSFGSLTSTIKFIRSRINGLICCCQIIWFCIFGILHVAHLQRWFRHKY
ncbi:TSUP family transporter [Staphylococcus aureus]